MTIKELQKQSHELSARNGFWDDIDPHNPRVIAEKLMLVVSELAEALEEIRSGHDPQHAYLNPNKPGKWEGFGIELADVMIRVADLAEASGIDLDEMIQAKHAYNLTRPYKHGKTL